MGKKSTSELERFAKRELQLAGMFDDDSDYSGALGEAVLALVQLLATQEHSGHSAAITLEVFQKVSNFENLTPLTSDPKEWIDHGNSLWQSRRNPKVFSNNGGKTWEKLSKEGKE